VIRQSAGWSNRFLPNPANRGQPTDFCTEQRQYKRVFSSEFVINKDKWFNYQAFVLGHRVALALPASVRAKQCSAGGSGGIGGGNGHEHREITEEYEDSSSEYVSEDFPEYTDPFKTARLQWIHEYMHTIQAATGRAVSTMTQDEGVSFKGRASCTAFTLGGQTSVPACYNVTTDDNLDVIIASGCTEPITDSKYSSISKNVVLPSEQLDTTYRIHIKPEVPGRHTVKVTYACTPRSRVGSPASSLVVPSLLMLLVALVAALL